MIDKYPCSSIYYSQHVIDLEKKLSIENRFTPIKSKYIDRFILLLDYKPHYPIPNQSQHNTHEGPYQKDFPKCIVIAELCIPNQGFGSYYQGTGRNGSKQAQKQDDQSF